MFKDRLLGHFITVLLQTLLHKTHALLTEDIQVAIYNMATVNFNAFFTTFLQQFVSSVDGVSGEQWEVLIRSFVHYHDKVSDCIYSDVFFCNSFTLLQDMPTFLHHLQRFIDDTRHYRMCNMNTSQSILNT